MSSKYTKKEFQKDLKKLAKLIEEHDKMEKRQRGGNNHTTSENMDHDTSIKMVVEDAEEDNKEDRGGNNHTTDENMMLTFPIKMAVEDAEEDNKETKRWQ